MAVPNIHAVAVACTAVFIILLVRRTRSRLPIRIIEFTYYLLTHAEAIGVKKEEKMFASIGYARMCEQESVVCTFMCNIISRIRLTVFIFHRRLMLEG